MMPDLEDVHRARSPSHLGLSGEPRVTGKYRLKGAVLHQQD
jgi:hypothetical protein